MPLWLLDNQIMDTRNKRMDLRDLYTSPSVLVFKSGRMCWTGHVGKSEGPRRLRRPRHRWEDDIKMGLKEISWRELSRLI